jgi:hypothetical protein
MKFDKHHIGCQISFGNGSTGYAACTDGKVNLLWKRMQEMAGDEKITGCTFWVTLKRGPIELTAHGSENYTNVLQRAERILLAAEKAFKAEHQEPAHV